jgi:ATP-dependent DNA helicase RecQ
MHIVNSVDGSVIVYTRNRERTKELSDMINAEGISATFYHAGLDFSIKERRQEQWQADEVRIMVATNAFGMGIDKPNVRLVIHMDCPDSIEAYFQEAGRAGRDGERAYAVLLCNGSDT